MGKHSRENGCPYDTVGCIARNIADGFTMVAFRDLIVTLSKGQDPGFGAIVKILHKWSNTPEPILVRQLGSSAGQSGRWLRRARCSRLNE